MLCALTGVYNPSVYWLSALALRDGESSDGLLMWLTRLMGREKLYCRTWPTEYSELMDCGRVDMVAGDMTSASEDTDVRLVSTESVASSSLSLRMETDFALAGEGARKNGDETVNSGGGSTALRSGNRALIGCQAGGDDLRWMSRISSGERSRRGLWLGYKGAENAPLTGDPFAASRTPLNLRCDETGR